MNDDKRPVILVVEDESIVALDVSNTLQSLGYDVLSPVDSGEAALSLLEERERDDGLPDLILLDIMLKGSLDGIQTAERIKKTWDIPFIYLSTFSDYKTLSRAKTTSPYGYITKHSHRNDLHSMIEMALYRHRMELEVQKREELLSVTLKSMSDAAIGASLDGTIMSWNRGATEIFGYSESEVVGKNLSFLTPTFYPNEMPEVLERIRNEEEVDHYETLRRRKDGAAINVSVKVSPIRGVDGEINGVTIIARDITARKQLEREILEISEKERNRIGKDLHDSLGQNLTGISLQLKVLEESLQEEGFREAAEQTGRISHMVNDAINQTRELAKNLLKVTLQNQGLSVALHELASYSESIYGSAVECSTRLEQEIGDDLTASQLYHITQEALTNAHRHGGARNCRIHLEELDCEYLLQILDDGSGIAEDFKPSLGMQIMEYRANMIDAYLTVRNLDNGGTVVSCRVPKSEETGSV
jgi:PAS domain S-box-containing protein